MTTCLHKLPRIVFGSGVAFLFLFAGCAELEKKLVRKKPEVVRPGGFLQVPMRLSNEEYYKGHFLLWHSWQQELADDLGVNHKREVRDVYEARRHLAALITYLEEEKAKQLEPELAHFDRLTEHVLKDTVGRSDSALLRLRLERFRLRVAHNFSYQDVRAFLKPNPPIVDLSAYQEENP